MTSLPLPPCRCLIFSHLACWLHLALLVFLKSKFVFVKLWAAIFLFLCSDMKWAVWTSNRLVKDTSSPSIPLKFQSDGAVYSPSRSLCEKLFGLHLSMWTRLLTGTFRYPNTISLSERLSRFKLIHHSSHGSLCLARPTCSAHLQFPSPDSSMDICPPPLTPFFYFWPSRLRMLARIYKTKRDSKSGLGRLCLLSH